MPFSTLNRTLLNLRTPYLHFARLPHHSLTTLKKPFMNLATPPKSYYSDISTQPPFIFLRMCSPFLRQVRVLTPWLFDLHQILLILFFSLILSPFVATLFILDPDSDWNAQTTYDGRVIRYVVSVDLSFAVSYSSLLFSLSHRRRTLLPHYFSRGLFFSQNRITRFNSKPSLPPLSRRISSHRLISY